MLAREDPSPTISRRRAGSRVVNFATAEMATSWAFSGRRAEIIATTGWSGSMPSSSRIPRPAPGNAEAPTPLRTTATRSGASRPFSRYAARACSETAITVAMQWRRTVATSRSRANSVGSSWNMVPLSME